MTKKNKIDKMTEQEYLEMKTREMEKVLELVEGIKNNPDPVISNRNIYPATDFKQMLKNTVLKFGDRVMYHQIMKGDTEFSQITFKEGYAHVNGLGTALIDMGLKDAHIGVIGSNCYEWAESYLAVTCGTGVVVPLDKELTKEELTHLCIEGEIEAVICCSEKHFKIFQEIKSEKNTNLNYVISTSIVNNEEENSSKGLESKGEAFEKSGCYSWHKLREKGIKMVEDGDRRFLDARICNKDLAVILFTSGTTGVAKGVMLSQYNIICDLMFSNPYMVVTEEDIFFSILPMHHTYESTCSFLEGIYVGSSVAFCRGLKYITKDMQMVHPTFLLAVPLIYEKFYNSIKRTLVKEGKEKLVDVLFAVNKVTSKVGINAANPVVKKMRAQFGGRIRRFIAGGAKVDPKVIAFFRNLGITTMQGYGLTETSPMVSLNPERRSKDDSAGKVLLYTDCKVDSPDENGNGELCFRGGQVMLGYYKNQEATDAVIKDGWFHTGDLGYVDKDNYVYITGRVKNVIIAANGKNVFPEELEEKIMRSKYIEECMVWADETGDETGHRGIFATIRVDKENAQKELGENINDEETVYQLIDKEIDKINANLPDWKSIKHIRIRNSEFVKTTGMKIKRFVSENKLGD